MINFREKDNLIKLGAILLTVISLVILIGWRYANPDVSLRNPLIIFSIMVILSLVAFFSNNLTKIFNKQTSEDKIPEPMSEEEIEERIKKEVEKRFWNHIKINGGFVCIKTKTINKNLIYAYKIELIYEEKFKEEKVNSLIALINANYKHIPVTFILPETSEHYLKNEMNNKSFNPEPEPDTEESTSFDATTGKPIFKQTKKSKKEKQKKEENKSDIE